MSNSNTAAAHAEEHHVLPDGLFILVWVGLLILTGDHGGRLGLSSRAGRHRRGHDRHARSRPTLILMYFMHLKYEKPGIRDHVPGGRGHPERLHGADLLRLPFSVRDRHERSFKLFGSGRQGLHLHPGHVGPPADRRDRGDDLLPGALPPVARTRIPPRSRTTSPWKRCGPCCRPSWCWSCSTTAGPASRSCGTSPRTPCRSPCKAQMWSWVFEYENGKQSTELYRAHGQAGVAEPRIGRRDPQLLRARLPAEGGLRARPRQPAPGSRPTRDGDFNIFCAEYCGERHSAMLSLVKSHARRRNSTNGWASTPGRRRARSC